MKNTASTLMKDLETARKESNKATDVFRDTKDKLIKQNQLLGNIIDKSQKEITTLENIQSNAMLKKQQNENVIKQLSDFLGTHDEA